MIEKVKLSPEPPNWFKCFVSLPKEYKNWRCDWSEQQQQRLIDGPIEERVKEQDGRKSIENETGAGGFTCNGRWLMERRIGSPLNDQRAAVRPRRSWTSVVFIWACSVASVSSCLVSYRSELWCGQLIGLMWDGDSPLGSQRGKMGRSGHCQFPLCQPLLWRTEREHWVVLLQDLEAVAGRRNMESANANAALISAHPHVDIYSLYTLANLVSQALF